MLLNFSDLTIEKRKIKHITHQLEHAITVYDNFFIRVLACDLNSETINECYSINCNLAQVNSNNRQLVCRLIRGKVHSGFVRCEPGTYSSIAIEFRIDEKECIKLLTRASILIEIVDKTNDITSV